LSRLLQ